MTAFDKYVDNLTLTVGHRGLSRINVNSLSMLHCRELVAGHGAPRIGSGGGLPGGILPVTRLWMFGTAPPFFALFVPQQRDTKQFFRTSSTSITP